MQKANVNMILLGLTMPFLREKQFFLLLHLIVDLII